MHNIKEIINKLTLEEKASLCSGLDYWHTKPVEHLGIPSIMVSDGPHGLRKQDLAADHLGINDSIKAVCFPAACATASSFDTELMNELGKTLGDECQAEEVNILLGPAINIKRSPLCGRNFEYISEDPFVAGTMSSAYIKGVESKGVGTSIKHFAANNQECRRLIASSNLDERTLREIYLSGFEIAIKDAKPSSVMCSYNRINGVLSSENKKLLTDILRTEWGYEGFVVSDWGAVSDRVEGIKAGLNLEMPSSKGITDAKIVKAVKDGTLSEEKLNSVVENLLTVIFEVTDSHKKQQFSKEDHHKKAISIEENSLVLLKNEGILPLKEDDSIAFIGEYAEKPRFQGGGSSHINNYKVTSALDSAKTYRTESDKPLSITYSKGFSGDYDETNNELINEAVENAKKAKVAVIFAGLPNSFECEGYDRDHLNLPDCQNELIKRVTEVQPNTVICLHNGSPVLMPWLKSVKGLIELYLGGQGVGEATINTLFGKNNPSGKLAETFPLKLEDSPCYLNFPGDSKDVTYAEGIYVGYRYYDVKKMDVLFPFGYGLSYTTFEYSNLSIDKETIHDDDVVTVSVDVTNTGDREGKEIVQLYISDNTKMISRPEKELKGFAKVNLNPHETKTVKIQLSARSFSWYSTELKDWFAASGEYVIQIAKSSRDIVLTKSVKFLTKKKLPLKVDINTTIEELLKREETRPIMEVYQKKNQDMMTSITQNEASSAKEAITEKMVNMMFYYNPLRAIRNLCNDSDEELAALIDKLNKALGN